MSNFKVDKGTNHRFVPNSHVISSIFEENKFNSQIEVDLVQHSAITPANLLFATVHVMASEISILKILM